MGSDDDGFIVVAFAVQGLRKQKKLRCIEGKRVNSWRNTSLCQFNCG